MKRFTLMTVLLAITTLTACGSEEPARKVATAPAGPRLVLQPTDTPGWQDVSAEITTVDQAQVLARIPGILSTLNVRRGDLVRQGQVIGRVVDSQLGYQSQAIGAQEAQAQAELTRVRYLYDKGFYAKSRLDLAEAAAATARAQHSAANAVSGQGTVVAPASGRVLRADIPAGSPVVPGMAIAVITAGPTVLRLYVPETLAGKVQVGAQVMTDGTDGAPAQGTVSKVYPAIAAGQFTVDVDLPGIDNSFVGRRLAAKVASGTRKALLVPTSFVTRRYGIDYVTLHTSDGSAAQVPVQTAPTGDPARIEILSGASAGDTLIGAIEPKRP